MSSFHCELHRPLIFNCACTSRPPQEEKKFTKTVLGKIQNSYQLAIQEIGELLKKRLDSLKIIKV